MKLRDKSKNKRRFLHNDRYKRTVNLLFKDRKKLSDWDFNIASLRMGWISVKPPEHIEQLYNQSIRSESKND